ncbi:MAG: hypothetical protein U0176_20545 [Bacteroidia bacterium]
MKSVYTLILALSMTVSGYVAMAQGSRGHMSSPSQGFSKGGGSSSSPSHSSPKSSYSQPSQSHSQPSYSQPKPSYSQPSQSYSQPSYSQPKPSYSQPSQSFSQPSYSQPKPTYSQPSYSQPSQSQPRPSYTQSTFGNPTQSGPSKPTTSQPNNTGRPTTDDRANTFTGVGSSPVVSYSNPKPNSSPRPTTDSRPTVSYITGFENPSNNTGRPTEVSNPRTDGVSTNGPTGRPTTTPGGPTTLSGGDDEPQEDPGNIGGDNRYVTICVDGNSIQVPFAQAQGYISSGGSMGPCNGGGGNGPIGHGNPVGNGGLDPIDHSGGNGGTIGHGNPVGPGTDPIDHGGSHGNNGGGHGHNGGWGHNGGPTPQGSWNGGGCYNPGPTGGYCGTSYYGYTGNTYNCNTWYIGSGCGHTYYGGFCGGCMHTNYFYSTNYYDYCTSYYGYGYYYPASYNVGWCYTGRYNGLVFTCIYPWIPRSYELESFTPESDNRRVVILDSKNGKRHWRVVEERAWVPERYVWDNGVQVKQDGYYTWKVVSKKKFRHKKRNCKICSPR